MTGGQASGNEGAWTVTGRENRFLKERNMTVVIDPSTKEDQRQGRIADANAIGGIFWNERKEAGRYPARVGDHS